MKKRKELSPEFEIKNLKFFIYGLFESLCANVGLNFLMINKAKQNHLSDLHLGPVAVL